MCGKWWYVRERNAFIATYQVSSTYFWRNKRKVIITRHVSDLIYSNSSADKKQLRSRCCQLFWQSWQKIIVYLFKRAKRFNVFSEGYNGMHACAHTLILKKMTALCEKWLVSAYAARKLASSSCDCEVRGNWKPRLCSACPRASRTLIHNTG